LHGWFITGISADGIRMINPKQFVSIAKSIKGNIPDEHRITRIVHQIEQRYKNLESNAVEGSGGANHESSGRQR